MGVYIKDMTMPICCAECEFLSGEAIPFGDYVCECIEEMSVDDEIVMEGRPDWCPLEEIVKCKDCEYYDNASHRCDSKGLMEENGFCSEARIRANDLDEVKEEVIIPDEIVREGRPGVRLRKSQTI